MTLITQHAARSTQLAAGACANVQGHGRTASMQPGGSLGRKACGDTHLGRNVTETVKLQEGQTAKYGQKKEDAEVWMLLVKRHGPLCTLAD